ncbi:hypothetical protein [Arcicella rosea]|uniref:N-acetylglucosaminyl deacetylase, LmbE family n=1 Tax=Arcicella rosea TaxID=502909 RepID=A0A841EMF5_9BACT|nr:hypothetical protein [Arcicella rosea]MBB6002599.1 hypothetical protein [Arcicella rosea]
MHDKVFKSVAIIVAHPDDEMLWAGGEILDKPLRLSLQEKRRRKSNPFFKF